MPELPEVEIVRRGLEPVLVGARLTGVEARRPDLRFPLPVGFARRLTGARVTALERRGKHLIFRLDRDDALIAHLGMSGRFVLGRTAGPAQPLAHAHVVFDTDRGDRITFCDPRRFGSMDLADASLADRHARLGALGVEPLGGGLDGGFLKDALAGRRGPIKTALLDQRLIAGLGNIYVCEALHRAGVSPRRRAGSLGLARLGRLAEAIRSVLEEAIAAGGSSLRDFAHADGTEGWFQHGFRVYGRAGEPCPTAGCRGIVRRIVQSGRATFHCPQCQR